MSESRIEHGEMAAEYARHYGVPPQGEGESLDSFRGRVGDWLRAQGKTIEAHEAYQNKRYENNDGVIDGAMGAIFQALSGKPQNPNMYNKRGTRQAGDDMAIGFLAQAPEEEEMSLEEAMLLMALFGGSE